MKYIKTFEEFMDETIYTGQEITDHVISNTPEDSDIPDYFIDNYILPNRFELNQVDLTRILRKDRSFRDYYKDVVKIGKKRYTDSEVEESGLDIPIVIYKNKILDGYSRATSILLSGGKKTWAYINI